MARQATGTAKEADPELNLPGNTPEYSVSEISGAVKRTLEQGFENVRVRGELGRISRPASGHVYLDLKDDRSVLAAVVWKGVVGRLRFQPEQGMEVVATGRVTTFPGQSKYQLVIEHLEPAGLGALMALLEARKKQFAEEGLFDEARKKPLPFLPRVIGIVTSPTGAVIRDMLHGFDERCPAHVVVWPVRVQGETCAAEVAAAIRGFNALPADGSGPVPRPDVLIVARGGGSLEDLWGFNEEVAVRAAAESALPLISAVGHETDWSLIDLAADARAPTPTKAAEWAVPRHSDLLERIGQAGERQRIAVRRCLEGTADRLRAASRGLPRLDVLLAEPRQRLDRCESRLTGALVGFTNTSGLRLAKVSARLAPGVLKARADSCRERLVALDTLSRQALMRIAGARRLRVEAAAARLRPASLSQRIERGAERLAVVDARARRAFVSAHETRRQRLDGLSKLLQSLSHKGVLARGFALVRDSSGAMVRRGAGLSPGALVEIEFADTRRDAAITEDRQGSGKSGGGEEKATGEARRPSRKPRGPEQGNLF